MVDGKGNGALDSTSTPDCESAATQSQAAEGDAVVVCRIGSSGPANPLTRQEYSELAEYLADKHGMALDQPGGPRLHQANQPFPIEPDPEPLDWKF